MQVSEIKFKSLAFKNYNHCIIRICEILIGSETAETKNKQILEIITQTYVDISFIRTGLLDFNPRNQPDAKAAKRKSKA